MGSKQRSAGAVIVALLLVLLFFTTGFGLHRLSLAVGASESVATAAGKSGVETPSNWHIFGEALGLLQRDFFGDLPQNEQLSYAAIRGVLERLDDPNTILVEPEAHRREQERFQGEFGGIGAQVTSNEAGQLVIVAPLRDTPASNADLRAQDIILEVDDQPITGMALNEAVELIKGPVGSEVRLLVLRPDDAFTFEVTLTRAQIPDPTVESRLIEDSDVGYIRLSFFSARTTDELRDAVTTLQEAGAQKYVLDLRDNPGGLLDAAIGTASVFLGEGVIAYQERNDGSREGLEAKGEPLAPEGAMVVLINGGSASASEILAGALQAYDRATLVGSTSFGKGTVQIPFTLSNGASLHVTIAHWLTPDGIDLSSQGLIPAVTIEPTDEELQAGEDPVLDRALELLEEQD